MHVLVMRQSDQCVHYSLDNNAGMLFHGCPLATPLK